MDNYINLMAKPIWSFKEWAAIAGIPLSTLEMLLRQNPLDSVFLLGRRRSVMQADALAWLERHALQNRWTPRQNVKRKKRRKPSPAQLRAAYRMLE